MKGRNLTHIDSHGLRKSKLVYDEIIINFEASVSLIKELVNVP